MRLTQSSTPTRAKSSDMRNKNVKIWGNLKIPLPNQKFLLPLQQ
jgi:hypothetical protein